MEETDTTERSVNEILEEAKGHFYKNLPRDFVGAQVEMAWVRHNLSHRLVGEGRKWAAYWQMYRAAGHADEVLIKINWKRDELFERQRAILAAIYRDIPWWLGGDPARYILLSR